VATAARSQAPPPTAARAPTRYKHLLFEAQYRQHPALQ
jgi:hypothetical protein